MLANRIGLLLMLSLMSFSVLSGSADVLSVKAQCDEVDCSFSVRVRHADTGWTHFANAWEILSTNGELLATRVLAHPHVDEQPFTRSLPKVPIPEGVSEVIVRARDSVHGYGGREVLVKLQRE